MILLEVRAVREDEEQGWMRNCSDPYARERALLSHDTSRLSVSLRSERSLTRELYSPNSEQSSQISGLNTRNRWRSPSLADACSALLVCRVSAAPIGAIDAAINNAPKMS